MKTVYHVLMHLAGLGCVAACVAIVATLGALNIHWSGWIAIAYFVLLMTGILAGWFPWRGRPLQLLIKGVYVMSAFALIGFGFSMKDPARPQLWMVLAGLGAVLVLRLLFKSLWPRPRTEKTHERQATAGESGPPAAPVRDPFFD